MFTGHDASEQVLPSSSLLGDGQSASKHESGTTQALHHQQQQQQQQAACSEAKAFSIRTEHQAGGDACTDRQPSTCSAEELAPCAGKPEAATAAGVAACNVAGTGGTPQSEHAACSVTAGTDSNNQSK